MQISEGTWAFLLNDVHLLFGEGKPSANRHGGSQRRPILSPPREFYIWGSILVVTVVGAAVGNEEAEQGCLTSCSVWNNADNENYSTFMVI